MNLTRTFFMLLLFCWGSMHTASAQDWTQKTDFGGTARNAAVGFSIGTKGYIGTGDDASSNKKDFWEYDPATGAWTQKADFGGTARFGAVGFSIGMKGYIGTGTDGSYKKDFWEYDPAGNAWTQKADFGGTARAFPVGFSIGTTKGYIGTGFAGSYKKDFWEYDPDANSWTQKADFGGTARRGAVGFSIGTKGYIGTGIDNSYKKDFWEYDPDANTWTQKADFGGTARHVAVGFSIGTKGYIGTGTDGSRFKDFWEYDSDANTWTQKADFGGTARQVAVGFSIGAKGYIGMGTDGSYKKDFWEYATPPPVISGPGTICSGSGTLSVPAQSGATYCWTSSAATPAWAAVGSAGFSAGDADNTSLAFSGSTPYVAYQDWGNDSKATVMKYNGTAWEAVGSAGFSAGSVFNISLAFSGSTPYVAYQDGGNDSKATVMKFNGTTWETVGNAGFSAGIAGNISLAFSGSTPYMAYQDGGNDFKATVMKFNGTTWEAVGSAGFSADNVTHISLAMYGSTPYVAYSDGGNGNKATVMKFNSTAWETVGDVGFSAGGVSYTSLAFSGSTPYVAYKDEYNDYKATVMKFNGTAWETVGSAGFSAGGVSYTSLAFSGSTPYVAYQDEYNDYKATVMKFNGTAWEQVGDVGFSAGEIYYTSIAFSGSTPYVAYQDEYNDYKTTVMKLETSCVSNTNELEVSESGTYTVAVTVGGTTATATQAVTVAEVVTPVISGPSTICPGSSSTLSVPEQPCATYCWTNSAAAAPAWENVGSAGFSAGTAYYTSLAFSGGTPYVAYRDVSNGDKATVMKFNGTTWENVGSAGFSAGKIYDISLAMDGSTPYVSYSDASNGNKATVMKFNGTTWENVGSAGFSAHFAYYTSLAFSGGTPYVAYADYGSSGRATVKKFNGTAWETVGDAGFSDYIAEYISLAFSGGTPYVAYQDGDNDYKATVMKFNGTDWENVGSAGFSADEVYYTSLAFSGSTPYVAYADYDNGEKATVMKFNGTAWETVGNAGFSADEVYNTSLAFSGSTPYVAYVDYDNGDKATVMKYNGTTWETVGSAGFSADYGEYTSLAFDGTTPYVVYSDYGNAGKATVMKFESCLSTSNELVVSEAGTYTVAVTVGGTTATATHEVTTAEVVTSMTLSNISACNGGGTTCEEDDTFTASINIDYSMIPATGTLDITSPSLVEPISIPVSDLSGTNIEIPGTFIANGTTQITLEGGFTANEDCVYLNADAGAAPAACSEFTPSNIEVTNMGECYADGTYVPNGTFNCAVRWSDMSDNHIQWTGSVWELRYDDGGDNNFDLATNSTGSLTELPCSGWASPIGCSTPMLSGGCGSIVNASVSGISMDNTSACDDNGTADGSDDTFTTDVTVAFEYAPAGGTLTLKQGSTVLATKEVDISLHCVTEWIFEGITLPADGAAISLTAEFSAECTLTENVGDAPVSCSCVPTTEICDGIDNDCNGTIDDVIVTCTAGTRTWTGAINTDWNTLCNWNPACVPTADDHVVIADVTNDPIIDASALAKSVVVNTGGVLTVAAAGTLTINGSTAFSGWTTAFGNNGTVNNNGTITVGTTTSAGNFGLYNRATFNNNTGGQINIDRSTLSGIYNSGTSATFTNAATITIGANQSAGSKGIENKATFNNNTGGQINIDRSNLSGIYNSGTSATFTNAATITIGANQSTGSNGIENEATFNNNIGGQINIDRSTYSGIINNGTSAAFTNAANITIGAVGSVGLYGIENRATFNNNTGGQINIDRSTSSGIGNRGSSAAFTNAASITIGANQSVGINGIENQATFNNNTGGQINIDRSTTDGINTSGPSAAFTNAASITIGAIASIGSTGINNQATFNNNTGGQINIDRSTTNGLNNFGPSVTFTNAASITIGAIASVGDYGIFNFATFNNNAGGQLNIDRSTTNGLFNLSGTFTNAASITFGAIASVGNFGINNFATINNNACGEISMTAPLNNASGKTFTNAGLFTVNTTGTHTNAGTVTNNGIIEYPQGNPIPGTVTNNEIIAKPISGGGVISPALTLGTTVDFSVATTWYLNANLTGIAGTYNAATNAFTNTNLADGVPTTVYFSINDATGGCARTVSMQITWFACTPVTEVCNGVDDDCDGEIDEDLITPYAVTGGGAYCAGGTGVTIGLSDSETGVSYQLKKDGADAGDPKSGTDEAISFENITEAGTYTVVATLTTTACTAEMTGSVEVTIRPLPTIEAVMDETYCAGENTTAITFTGTGATSYTWTNDNTATGLAASGTGDIASFVATNNTGAAITSTVTVTPVASGSPVCTVTPITFTLTVVKPVITCPADRTVNADQGQCSSVQMYNVTTTDNCSATTQPTAGLSSGAAFPVGITINAFLATDAAGNTATCSFSIRVLDTQLPTVACPANTTLGIGDNCSTPLASYGLATKSDNCSTAIFEAQSPVAGTIVTGHNTAQTVTLTATDASGNTASCSFVVTLKDVLAPSITCPANIIRSTDLNLCSAVVTYATPIYSDNCSGGGAVHLNGGISGSTFDKGISTVNWQATDGIGLTKTCSFTITVNDAQAPTITCPANMVRSNDAGQCSAVVTYPTPKAADNCNLPAGQPQWVSGGTTPTASGANSVSTFQKGLNIVTWRSTDGAGLTKTCTFRVTVNDTEAPTLTCPAAMSLTTAPNTCSSVATTYTNPTFTDNCAPLSGTATRISGLASGSTFPLGNSNVVFQATDAAGNTRRCTMVITVTDNQAPVITCPAAVTATGTGTPCRATVFYGSTTASDNCAGTLTPFLVTGLASGSPYPAGVTTNTFRAVAPNGQSSECSFTVTVDCGSGMGNNGVEVRNTDLNMQHSDKLELKIAPNPALSTVTVSIEGVGAGGGTLLVFDAVGRLVLRQVIAENQQTAVFQVDGSEFAPGLYRVNLRTASGMVTKTLVVVK